MVTGEIAKFGVLGPLQVDGEDVGLPAKLRALLAALLLRANRVVPVDTLIDAIWGESSPASARVTLQGYVRRLRQQLGGRRIVTRFPGYLIAVPPGGLDLDAFTSHYDRGLAAAATGNWMAASSTFTTALALWRGDPLADVPSELLRHTEVPRLAELRLLAIESRVEADLRLGRHAELIAELRHLVTREPMRETLHGQLMLALYRCGRQGEALSVYRDIDRVLRDELGVSAGPELGQLHARMLAADPALAWNARAATAAANEPRVHGATGPAQLPPDIPDFTARRDEVRQLSQAITADPGRERPGSVAVCVVTGMGGIGKTALAVHVAHRLRERFPDGQLYAELGGAASPVAQAEVLSRFLRDLGDPEPRAEDAVADLSARFRTRLAHRKMLIVLDDAADAAQVRPLLPGSAGSGVIVTSRGPLTGLAGAAHITLGALGHEDSLSLFTAIVGPDRVNAEHAAACEVLSYCAGLPLAVRVAAQRLVARPSWDVAHLAARLADGRGRLAELATGDLAVQASIAASYTALRASPADSRDGMSAAKLFRLLGLPGKAVMCLNAIAALAGRPRAEVRTMLEELTDARLIDSVAPDLYRIHELIRCYAADLAERIDSAHDRGTALLRIVFWRAVTAPVPSPSGCT
jgi:DNA-binding SARP family transcriptional activator